MENQGTVIQLSLWESIAGLLCLSPVFIAGLAVTCIILSLTSRKINSRSIYFFYS